jgi:hypothetical protein
MQLLESNEETPQMKLEISKREDSRGIALYSRFVSLFVHGWKAWRYQKPSTFGWCVKVKFGRGAGYQRGRTLFLGWRVRGGPVRYHHKPALFRAGFTQDANSLPYGFR